MENPTEMDPASLVQRIEDGDSEAERELYELHHRGLVYLLRRLTQDPALAEDLAQDTFRIVLERVRQGDLREPEKLAGFVRGTAKNLVIAERRKRYRRGVPEDLEAVPEPADPSPGRLGELLRAEDRQRIRTLLGELRSSRDRQILFRFHIAEEPREQICRDLGLDRQQFNLVMFRARKRFRQLVLESEES